MTRASGGARQVLAVAAVMVASAASLATSESCEESVDISGAARLSAEQQQAVQHYRVVAPLGTEFEVEANIRGAPGISVRLAVMPVEPPALTDAGESASSIAVVIGPNEQAEQRRLPLPPCIAPGCEDYRIRFEVSLLNGAAAEVEWVARASLKDCSLSAQDHDDYFEIRRD